MNTVRPTHVFVAGDTTRWRKKIKAALPEHGIITHFGTDRIDAFNASLNEAEQPDIYILANKMPEPDDGLLFLREFRGDGCTEPVIICSVHVSDTASEEIARLDGIHINWSPEEPTDKIAATIQQLLTT
jgi:CheY-like chemotaxis protein